MVHRYTVEQKEFIQLHYKCRGNKELTEMFNAHFGLALKVSQVKSYKKNQKWSSGLDGRFKPADVSKNKGKKYPGQVNRTSFKKGQRPTNFRPVGSERVRVDGYIEIKVSDPDKWRLKQLVIWEEAYGAIPKGHRLVFLDGDKLNVTLDNLQMITQSQLARLNQHHLISDNPELTKTGIIIAGIYNKIGERKKNI